MRRHIWLLIDHGSDCSTADAFSTRERALRYVEAEILDADELKALTWQISETNPDYWEASYSDGHLTIRKATVDEGMVSA